MPSLGLGALRDVVDVWHDVETPDGQGGASLAPALFAAGVPANVVALGSTQEFRAAAAVASHAKYLVEMAYRADLTAAMRLTWSPWLAPAPKVLEILGLYPKPDQAGRLVLECVEVSG